MQGERTAKQLNIPEVEGQGSREKFPDPRTPQAACAQQVYDSLYRPDAVKHQATVNAYHQKAKAYGGRGQYGPIARRWRSDDRPAVRGDQGTRSGNGCLSGRANELVSKYYMRPTRSEQATESRPYGGPNA